MTWVVVIQLTSEHLILLVYYSSIALQEYKALRHFPSKLQRLNMEHRHCKIRADNLERKMLTVSEDPDIGHRDHWSSLPAIHSTSWFCCFVARPNEHHLQYDMFIL